MILTIIQWLIFIGLAWGIALHIYAFIVNRRKAKNRPRAKGVTK